MAEITLQELLEAGAYFGHQPRRWNPKMEPYLYGVREGIHIFDLVKTKKKLEEAYDYVRQLSAGGKLIIFVGTKRQAADIIIEEAKRAEVPYVSQRWLGGTVTNWEQIKKGIKKLISMKEKKEAGEYKKYTKKENVLIDREITKLEKFLGGLTTLKNNPDALFIVDVKREEAAVKEASKRGIPLIAMVDSNADPTPINYVIPINDDSVRTIKLIVSKIADAVIDGRQIWEKTRKPAVGQTITKKPTQKRQDKKIVKAKTPKDKK